MHNQKLFKRFVASTTTVALAFGTVAPVTVALAEDNATNLIATLDEAASTVSAAQLVELVKAALAQYGISLTAPDASGIASIVTGGDDITDIKLDLNVLFDAVGLKVEGMLDTSVDLTPLFAAAGISDFTTDEISQLVGGLSANHLDAVIGFLNDTGIAEITVAAVAQQVADGLVGVAQTLSQVKIPSIELPSIDFSKIELPETILGDLDLNSLAKIVGLKESALPKGFDDFNDLKDVSKLIAFANSLDLNEFVKLASVYESLGLGNVDFPKELLDLNNVKKPEEILKGLEKLDLNDFVDLKKVIEDAGYGSYDLPEELFDANSIKDPATLQKIWDEVDLNQFLHLNEVLSNEQVQNFLAGLGAAELVNGIAEDLKLPEGFSDLNNIKDPNKYLDLLSQVDLDNLAEALGGAAGLSLADLLGYFDGLESFNALKEEGGLAEAYQDADLDKLCDSLAGLVGMSSADVLKYLEGVESLNEIKDEGAVQKFIEALAIDQILKDAGLSETIKQYTGLESLEQFKDPEKLTAEVEKLKKEVGDKNIENIAEMLLNLIGAGETQPSGWIQMSDGTWKYWDADKKEVVTGWKNVDGKWYLFDGFGTMKTGWQNVNGTWYFLGSSGAMKNGWQFIWGHWFYLGAPNFNDGAMRTGTFQDHTGAWFTCDANGYWVA